MNLIEIAEKTCKSRDTRVFNNYPEEIYHFSIQELAKFAMEVIREYQASETD